MAIHKKFSGRAGKRSSRSRNLLRASLVLSACTLAGTQAMAEDVTAPGDVVYDGIKVATPLTSKAGDAAAGKETFVSRSLGNCLACHAASDASDHLFHGEVGPSLDGVGGRYSEEILRGIVVDAKKVFTHLTVMPGFYSLEVGENPRKDLVGKTILSAQEVEDVVAYLKTLK